MLYTMHPSILEAAVNGDLAKELADRDSQASRQVRRIGEIIEIFDGRIPCIYVHFLVNTRGDAPTRDEMQNVCLDVRRYVGGDDDFARQIDCAINVKPAEGPGHRRYIPNAAARKVILDFLHDLERGLGAYTGTEPLPLPLGEVGYTWKPWERLPCHRDHKSSSNYLMMLWEAATHRRYPQYRMSQNVVMICLQAEQSWMGEVAFTQLLHSYIFEGRGFNHMPAGLSVNSGLETVSAVEWAELRMEVTRGRDIMDEIENGMARAKAANGEVKVRREEELRRGQEEEDREKKDLQELEEAFELTVELMHLGLE